MATGPKQLKEIIKNAEWFDQETMQVYAFNIPKTVEVGNKITILIEATANNLRGYGSNRSHIVWRTGAIRIFYPDSYENDYEYFYMRVVDELEDHNFGVQSVYGPNYTPDTETIYVRIKYQKTDYKEDVVELGNEKP